MSSEKDQSRNSAVEKPILAAARGEKIRTKRDRVRCAERKTELASSPGEPVETAVRCARRAYLC